MTNAYEKPNLCKVCGGKCCLEAPCILDVSDIKDLTASGIVSEIKRRNLSIQGLNLAYAYEAMDVYSFPYLYLSSRVENGDEVDLLALEGKCANVTDNGCIFDANERPKGGRELIPTKNFRCRYKSKNTILEIIATWKECQDALREATQILTGSSATSMAENLYQDILTNEDVYSGSLRLPASEFTLSYLYCFLVNGIGVKMSPAMALFVNDFVNKHPLDAEKIIDFIRNNAEKYNNESILQARLVRKFN